MKMDSYIFNETIINNIYIHDYKQKHCWFGITLFPQLYMCILIYTLFLGGGLHSTSTRVLSYFSQNACSFFLRMIN